MSDLRARLLKLTPDQRLFALLWLVHSVPDALADAIKEAEDWKGLPS